MYEGGDGKKGETIPHIRDEPSKLQNFPPSNLLLFTVSQRNGDREKRKEKII